MQKRRHIPAIRAVGGHGQYARAVAVDQPAQMAHLLAIVMIRYAAHHIQPMARSFLYRAFFQLRRYVNAVGRQHQADSAARQSAAHHNIGRGIRHIGARSAQGI